MTKIPLEALGMEKMASGHLCLNLTEMVTWEDFPEYGKSLLRVLGGTRIDIAESVEMRIWDVSIYEVELSLVWDDFPAMLSLESSSSEGDAVLQRIHEILIAEANRSQHHR